MTRLCARLLLVLAVMTPLSAPVAASAGGKHDTTVTVMSRNIYLGSDLTPALLATTPAQFVGAVAVIWGTVGFTDFPTRAGALADEVAANRPDLIGLQEVSHWNVAGAVTVDLDFLTVLQAQLAARGLHYAVAATSDNADIGPAPLVAPGCALGTCSIRFRDRDVILVNTDRGGLTTSDARSGTYATQQTATTPVGPLSFRRGWATTEVNLDGHRFRFADTHLETEDAPAVQQAQGKEFLAAVKTQGPIIAVGDFNSASDGSTTTTYASLTSDYFRDAAAGVGNTCCQSGTLTNPVSQLHTRIDLVLTHANAQPQSAVKVGAVPFQAAPPFWASDHAGVVATLRLP